MGNFQIWSVVALVVAALGIVSPSSAQSRRGVQADDAAMRGKVLCFGSIAADDDLALRQTNALRTSQGLPVLRTNRALTKAAAQHACDMATRARMTHVGTKSSGPRQRVKAAGYKMRLVAENIGVGFPEVNGVTHAWEVSSGHRANITIPQVREFGIGKAIGADGKTYWAAVYAMPR